MQEAGAANGTGNRRADHLRTDCLSHRRWGIRPALLPRAGTGSRERVVGLGCPVGSQRRDHEVSLEGMLGLEYGGDQHVLALASADSLPWLLVQPAWRRTGQGQFPRSR